MKPRLAVVLCAAVMGVISSAAGAESGIASVYAYGGSKTASGERANPSALTAAHRTLPFGTKVRVTNKRNGKSVVVRINDRGPFLRGRVIDLTPAGARALGFSGLARVTLEPVSKVAGRSEGATNRAERKRGAESFAKTVAPAPTAPTRNSQASGVVGSTSMDITGSIAPVTIDAPERTANVAKAADFQTASTVTASRSSRRETAASPAGPNPKEALLRFWGWITGR
jgi:rare lipoprotein A